MKYLVVFLPWRKSDHCCVVCSFNHAIELCLIRSKRAHSDLTDLRRIYQLVYSSHIFVSERIQVLEVLVNGFKTRIGQMCLMPGLDAPTVQEKTGMFYGMMDKAVDRHFPKVTKIKNVIAQTNHG